MLPLTINGRQIKGLLDTGADRSIISQRDWPSSWPTNVAEQTLQGLRFVHAPKISARLLSWQDEEGHSGHFQPYVLQLPVTLWGRDILVDMDVTLNTGYSKKAQALLKKMGYTPGKGLGIKLQGRTSPVQTVVKQDRKGLGFS